MFRGVESDKMKSLPFICYQTWGLFLFCIPSNARQGTVSGYSSSRKLCQIKLLAVAVSGGDSGVVLVVLKCH